MCDFAPNALPSKEWFSRYEHFKKDDGNHRRQPGGRIEASRQAAANQHVPMQGLARQYIERGIKEDVV